MEPGSSVGNSSTATQADGAGTSRRAAKKRETRERILANAIALFREQGLRATRLAQVADRSDVSGATLFNYFQTKGALAEAFVRGELESVLADAIGEAVATDHSLRVAIRQACRTLAEATSREPGLRLEAWREAGRARRRGSAGGRGAVSRRGALIDGLGAEQARGHLRGDLPPETLADLVLDAIEGGLIAGLDRDGPAAPRELAQAAGARVDLVLDGARKRNERVRPPTRRA